LPTIGSRKHFTGTDAPAGEATVEAAALQRITGFARSSDNG
jgi:hypothetical protein